MFARTKLRVALGGSALLVVAVLVVGAIDRHRWRRADQLVAAYVLWSFAAFLVAPGLGQQWMGERYQFQGMASVVVYATAYAAARRFASGTSRLALLLWWVLAGVTHVAVYAMLQRLDLDPVWDTLLDGRVFSTIGNPNTLASVLVMGLPLAVWFALRGSRLERLVAGASVVALVAALAWTSSRGGYLAVVAGTVVFAALAPRPSRSALELCAAASCVVVAMVLAVTPVRAAVEETWDRAVTALDSADESRRFHEDGWRVTLAMIADHPFFGVGHERFPEEFPAYRDEVLSPSAIERFSPYRLESPHNVPLAIAVGAGLPALAFYVVLVAVTLDALRRAHVEQTMRAALAAAVAAHLVADLFVTADLTSAMIFWALLGGIMSLPERCRGRWLSPADAVRGVPVDVRTLAAQRWGDDEPVPRRD